MIRKIILTIFVWLFFSYKVFAGESCLLSDNASELKCEREVYLEQNISEIANSYWVSEVLWWTFYTTILDRLNDETVVVNFEDWHIVIIAEVSFDEENNITEFNVIFPEDSDNTTPAEIIEEKEQVGVLQNFFNRIVNFFRGILK